MSIREKTLQNIESAIIAFFVDQGITPAVTLERPVDFEYGYVSTNAPLAQAKALKKDPYVLAEELASYLTEQKIKYITEVRTAKPGFVNIFFDEQFYKELLSEIDELKDSFGKNNSLKGQKWVVEHTSPNPNKAMHLGHLRNNITGMSLIHLLNANGAKVISDMVDN